MSTPMVVAEIGINHNGSLDIARQLIDVAKEAGCDAVKFQKRTVDIVYTPAYLASSRESPWGTTQREQKEGLEFGEAEYDEIDRYCFDRGIEWFASAWDVPSQDFLRRYELRYNKIASAMLTHRPLLEAVASEGRHIFASTGMSTEEEIAEAVSVFRAANCPFTLLHTVSEYPAPEEALHLEYMARLRERFACDVGYSGHEVGVVPSVVAAALGATVIERHITLDRAMYGSDQAASLEPRGLELLVKYVHSAARVVGGRHITEGEREVARKLRYWRPEEEA